MLCAALQIAARPGAHNLRCLFRVAYVPKDACQLAQRDLTAFEYLYLQVSSAKTGDHQRSTPDAYSKSIPIDMIMSSQNVFWGN